MTVTQEGTDVPVEDPYLEVDTSGWTLLAHTAASKEVNVVSNVEWNAYTDADWCSVSPSSGDGNGVIKVTAKENDTKKLREAVVTISSATLTCRIVVIQPGSSGTEGFEDEDGLNLYYENINQSFFLQILKDMKASGFVKNAQENGILDAYQNYSFYTYDATNDFGVKIRLEFDGSEKTLLIILSK